MVSRWPLVGRDQELADLLQVLGSRGGPKGVAVFGGAGVGKTRLVSEAIGAHRADGAAAEWVRATEAAREIPLGSFTHLLAPGDEAHRRDDLLHLALTRLLNRADGQRFLLAVDDAHLLDDASVALLHLAVTQSPVRVLASVRTGVPLPPGLVGLWKDELLARLDVRPLSHAATEDLVLSVLGDAVPASLLDRIWQLSRGNPLFVRELVTVALERREDGSGGQIVLPAHGTGERLRELVEERLRLLDPGRRAALEIVAVGEQVPLEAVERIVGPGDIEALEQRRLVEVVDVVDVGAGATVQVSHPLYREVLAAALPRLRRRAVLRDLVSAVEGTHQFDRLRLATWRLESGEPGDPEQLLLLAREALGRLDHRLAERLALAAGGVSRVDAGLVVGEALSGQGRPEQAEAILAELRPTDPEQTARLAIAHASHLFLQLDRSGQAFDVLQAAVDELSGHPTWQAECRSALAQMLWFAVRPAEAGHLADELLALPDLPEPARVRAVSVAAATWSAKGRLDAALALLDDDVHALARRHRRDVPYGDIQLRMVRFLALFWAGRAHDLDRYTVANLGLDLEAVPPSLSGLVSGFRGGALLERGLARAALAELQRSVRALAEFDWFGQRPLAEAMRARAAVFAGELATAEEAIQAADTAFAADRVRGARTLPFIELSRAWLLAAQGAVADAAGRCVALATAMEHLVKPLAVEALHAAVRLGRAADARPALERLHGDVDGPFVGLALRHAVAVTESDPHLLVSVADGFEELGADLLAAEAQRTAANAYRRQGRGAAAATAARHGDTLLRRCDSPRSPALDPLALAGEELSKREREVAVLAAGGRTSAEIAKALYVSVRTVDTHLHRVYRKLMIEGRHELADALGPAPSGPSGPSERET